MRSNESESEFIAEVLEYVGFGADDEAALRALHPHASPDFTNISEHFYEQLSNHSKAKSVFSGPEQVQRLKVTLVDWLDRLLSGPWDDDYFAARARIGRVHVKVRLPQRYMLTAMNGIRADLMAIAETAFAEAPDERQRVEAAIGKILDVELAVMLETYRDDWVADVRRTEALEKDLLRNRLQITESRYTAIVENAAALVIATDADHKTLLFNRAAELTSGYTRGEVLGKDCLRTLCFEDDRPHVQDAMERAIAGIATSAFDARLVTRDDEARWVRWHITPLAAAEGNLACAIGVDVTEERSLEQRTRRAERLASLGTLAAGLAHEIRNPLNAAKLQLMLVDRQLGKLEEQTASKAVRASGIVRDELERLAGLVQDFLSFARPSQLRLATTDLRGLTEDMATLLAPDAEDAGVALGVESGDDALRSRCDGEKLKQVLLNIMRNAIEAAGRGGTVTVSLEQTGGETCVRVADTGPGLPDGVDVFEPFATTKEGGTGLGLPICHRIISDHGGDLSVDRVADQTVFTIALPIAGPPEL